MSSRRERRGTQGATGWQGMRDGGDAESLLGRFFGHSPASGCSYVAVDETSTVRGEIELQREGLLRFVFANRNSGTT
jgi:hypothetical protein